MKMIAGVVTAWRKSEVGNNMATSFKSINCKEIRYHFVRHKSIILQWTITFFSCQSCLPQYTVDHPCYVVNFWYHTIQWHHQESRKIAEMSLLPKPINRDSTKQVVQTWKRKECPSICNCTGICIFFNSLCVFLPLVNHHQWKNHTTHWKK